MDRTQRSPSDSVSESNVPLDPCSTPAYHSKSLPCLYSYWSKLFLEFLEGRSRWSSTREQWSDRQKDEAYLYQYQPYIYACIVFSFLEQLDSAMPVLESERDCRPSNETDPADRIHPTTQCSIENPCLPPSSQSPIRWLGWPAELVLALWLRTNSFRKLFRRVQCEIGYHPMKSLRFLEKTTLLLVNNSISYETSGDLQSTKLDRSAYSISSGWRASGRGTRRKTQKLYYLTISNMLSFLLARLSVNDSLSTVLYQ